MKLFRTILILLTCAFIGCGTLGGFQIRTFSVSKQDLVQAIDTLFSKYPQYKIPDKWKAYDDWSKRGYDFLDSRIFYFKSGPEEMYYVTFVPPDSSLINYKIGIAVRATYIGTDGWTLEDETSSADKKRIESRFDQEIISKLEKYASMRATRE